MSPLKIEYIIDICLFDNFNIYHSRNRPPPRDVGGLCREKKAPITIWASDDGEIARNKYMRKRFFSFFINMFIHYSKTIEWV